MSLTQVKAGRRFFLGAASLAILAGFKQPLAQSAATALQKRPVPIRRSLALFDRAALDGFSFSVDEGIRTRNDVGTKEFIEWRLKPESREIRQAREAILQMYYYTERGTTPVVPHTPELCARQQGDQVIDMGELSIPAPTGMEGSEIPTKFVRMIQTTQKGQIDLLTVYTFCVNGEFVSDREWARFKMAMPWRRALYFVKVQCVVLIPSPDDVDVAELAAKQLMSAAIMELIVHHLPKEADLRGAQ